MSGKIHLLITIFFLFVGKFCGAQTNQLSDKDKADVIRSISEQLRDHYVFEDSALLMSNAIQQQLKNGAYIKVKEPVVFAEKLMHDLRSVCDDRHLLVQYNPEFATRLSNPAPAAEASPLRTLQEVNFGFQKVEILPGNIGYLSLLSFRADPANGLETMKAALRFLEFTRAIVIDLRSNGGGSQETATLLMGFFLDKRTHVERFYNRGTGQYTDYWTQPDSSFQRFWKKPLYVLTSHKSFSCAEMFAYDLKMLKRAKIIGEVTGGGAHGEFEVDLKHGFIMHLPYWRGINPISGTNWERVGVKPDIETNETEALEKAELEVFNASLAEAATETERFNLNWQLELLIAANRPLTLDSSLLKKRCGLYGERRISWEHGKLYYQREGRPKFELWILSANRMAPVNNSYFKVEFTESDPAKNENLRVYYQDGRVEEAVRIGEK